MNFSRVHGSKCLYHLETVFMHNMMICVCQEWLTPASLQRNDLWRWRWPDICHSFPSVCEASFTGKDVKLFLLANIRYLQKLFRKYTVYSSWKSPEDQLESKISFRYQHFYFQIFLFIAVLLFFPTACVKEIFLVEIESCYILEETQTQKNKTFHVRF